MNWKQIGSTVIGLSAIVIFANILYLGNTRAQSQIVFGGPFYMFAALLAIGSFSNIFASRGVGDFTNRVLALRAGSDSSLGKSIYSIEQETL